MDLFRCFISFLVCLLFLSLYLFCSSLILTIPTIYIIPFSAAICFVFALSLFVLYPHFSVHTLDIKGYNAQMLTLSKGWNVLACVE